MPVLDEIHVLLHKSARERDDDSRLSGKKVVWCEGFELFISNVDTREGREFTTAAAS